LFRPVREGPRVTAKGGCDPWAAWLGERRHGGDPELLRRQLEVLAPIRDQIIADAALDARAPRWPAVRWRSSCAPTAGAA
jgi:hypothetical protein